METSSDNTLFDTEDRPCPNESRWLIGVVAGAAILRLLLFVFQRSELHTDPDAYVALAKTIRTTGGFHSPGTELPTAFRPPLYPVLLALLTAIGCSMSFAVGMISVCAGAVVTAAT